jgi:hypothetical protein
VQDLSFEAAKSLYKIADKKDKFLMKVFVKQVLIPELMIQKSPT